MEQEKVTRNELRELHVGQTRIFHLTERKKVTSAAVTAKQMMDESEDGLTFVVKKDYESKAISITRTN